MKQLFGGLTGLVVFLLPLPAHCSAHVDCPVIAGLAYCEKQEFGLVVETTPARSSVVKSAQGAPLNRLATKAGE